MTEEKKSLKLVTPEFRGSFVNLMKPRAFADGQDAKYSMTISVPKTDKFWTDLKNNMDSACMTKWGEIPKKLKTFIKDGDEEDEKYNWQGMNLFTASNKDKPGIVVKSEQGLVEPMDESEIYSGAYYRASIRPYAYEYNKSKGVAISLDNVMKVMDGDKFTSRTKATEDFADFVEGDWE